ncbi:type VII secretion protein EssC [Heyndrickxia sporothermodurans]|uniref:Type VII secretion protein EssC n=1 Tax=Heyndrickxia sporothermodurans TaxID=46224 RepID=A0AB37HLW4_9BACI|nr:type VII secretion protein EssC [Heyndrickxia sporothermodurans]MBL5768608.1 type VII secretion protein EssC [Heyndrickxia sporothermodurans]MBL5772316.1 type VII secretion protein EssC [Heyndrickxia sporothermodurans]MBL5775881.1 type VII secretion protein EssC [Heyndrickxia sporothermodurans]MBL5779389.1 type VII secretion protein EssC [Heyndrickxia sporothermodurans]MBL5782983.1 type VII secretion protein EssC [Heyndrickxia sporothermodurans]
MMAQRLLLLNDGNQLHKCHLKKNKPQKITIGSDWSNTITFEGWRQPLTMEWDGEVCQIGEQQLRINEQLVWKNEAHQMRFFLTDATEWDKYDTTRCESITLGANEYDDVKIKNTTVDALLIRDQLESSFKLEVYSGEVYHNFLRVTGNTVIEPGDQLFLDGLMIKIGNDDIDILANESLDATKLVRLYGESQSLDDEYPDYHRSPRIIYREPEEKRKIANPSSMPGKPSEQLARVIVPPLVMIAAMVVVSFFQRSGIYLIVMFSMTIVTVIFSITTYVKNVRQYRSDIKERDKSYREYLKQKTQELYKVSQEQRHALNYHYPSIEKLRDMTMKVHSRIYEKTMFHHDFLMYRVGRGDIDSSFEIELNMEEFTLKKDELMEEAKKLRSQYLKLEDVPVVTSLIKGPVGYIGQRHFVLEQLQLLVMQTAVFQSYYDLQFVIIFPEEEKEKWEWMRWLPHASLRDINVRGFVFHERSRDQVLNSLYQILKERKLAIDEKGNKNEKIYFAPHFVILITDEKMILDHSIMEYFNEDPSELGVSLIFVQDVMQSLPEHVKTVIDIRDAANGNIILEEGELVNRKFTLDHFPKGFNKEDISRALASLNHLQNLKNSIPESVTFLEMYGVEKVEELRIPERWAQNETYKSLAVPLGLRGKEDIVQLNLHEKAHGPHGLVAGTTGSGKSEIIQSYIISLAVNFHPYEVAFLLIDYKGGGMANLFKHLPHLLGTITNLDGAQSMRALASIKAELQKRQRLFGEHDVNHINQYQKLYKSGEASEPMPHLFLISDEFAELKSEQPDFMKELVSTARIGRSLGIHLILATQKPSGVVDDQIWSNSKFKLALKVQNTSDSTEILKTPDAAEITLPGRAYLQVGNNEIYELFQSAWSGADYIPDKSDDNSMDTTIYSINELGQYDILSNDLSGLGNKENISKVPTELDAVIDYIHSYANENNIAELPRPWLPPLEEAIFLPDLHAVDYRNAWYQEKKPIEVTFGFLDIPEMQAQEPITINLTKDGHMAVFSSPGFGKSTFLQTVVMDIARQHNPERVHIYLIDLGTNGLLPLKDLPHVADTIMVDEEIKLGKLFRRIKNELKERKNKLSKYGVANIEMYEKASREEVPNILFIIDMIDSINDAPYKDDFEQVAAQIAREGVSVGIHMVISAGRQNAMRAPLLANIKHQISLYIIDEMESRNIVGRTDLRIEEIPGRGLVKLEKPTSFQTALPVKGKDTLEMIKGIQAESKEMRSIWSGDLPSPIPMVPEVMEFSHFINRPETKTIINNGGIPFAVDFENVEPMELSVVKDQNTLILSDMMDSIEQTYLTLIASITVNEYIDVGMIDNASSRFSIYKENVDIYAENRATMDVFVERLLELFEAREDAFRQVQLETNGRATMNEFMKDIRPMIVLITDVSFVINTMSDNAQTTLAKLIETGARVGIHFVVGIMYGAIDRSYDDIASILKKQKVGVLIGRISDQNILDVMNRPYKEKNLLPYEAYYVKQGKAEKIKIAAPFQKREEVKVNV